MCLCPTGQKVSCVAQVVTTLPQRGAMEYMIVELKQQIL